jgi:hypothetical protein
MAQEAPERGFARAKDGIRKVQAAALVRRTHKSAVKDDLNAPPRVRLQSKANAAQTRSGVC